MANSSKFVGDLRGQRRRKHTPQSSQPLHQSIGISSLYRPDRRENTTNSRRASGYACHLLPGPKFLQILGGLSSSTFRTGTHANPRQPASMPLYLPLPTLSRHRKHTHPLGSPSRCRCRPLWRPLSAELSAIGSAGCWGVWAVGRIVDIPVTTDGNTTSEVICVASSILSPIFFSASIHEYCRCEKHVCFLHCYLGLIVPRSALRKGGCVSKRRLRVPGGL